MKKSLRSLVLLTGIVSTSALGSTFALADDAAPAPAPAAAQAQGEHRHGCQGGKHRGGHHVFAKIARKLGLSDQQKTQARAIFKENRAQAKPTLVSLRAERHQLHNLIQSGTADEGAIRAESAKVSALQADLAVQRAKGAKQLLALLTPDQQAKWQALRAEREQKFQKSCNKGAHSEE
jgi:periplasmic protein CpxP/Spy